MYNREEFMLKYKNAKERVGYLDGEVASLLARLLGGGVFDSA